MITLSKATQDRQFICLTALDYSQGSVTLCPPPWRPASSELTPAADQCAFLSHRAESPSHGATHPERVSLPTSIDFLSKHQNCSFALNLMLYVKNTKDIPIIQYQNYYFWFRCYESTTGTFSGWGVFSQNSMRQSTNMTYCGSKSEYKARLQK